MQILLAILIATAASQVQSAGFACSKCPTLSNLYSLGIDISGRKVPEAPDSSSGDYSYNLLQHLNGKLIHFIKQYEVAETEVDCKSLLCDQKLEFLWDVNERTTVSSIFEEYNVLYENYVEQLGRGVYNLSSEYCQAADKKIQEIVYLAGPVIEKLSEYLLAPKLAVNSNFHGFNDLIYSDIFSKFDGADRNKCRYLNPEFLKCVGRDFSEFDFRTLPKALQNQINYFLEYCNKIKHELESMKGPGIDCD